jgi:amidohydrolase
MGVQANLQGGQPTEMDEMKKDIARLKQRVMGEVDARREELVRLADRIHAAPEVAFQEHAAAALLSGLLEENGFGVERGVAGLETAYVATVSGPAEGPRIAFLAEYDALPGLGHACGHNLIAASAVGAGLAVQELLSELAGTIQVIGTPGEEGRAGKAIMVRAGVFEGLDAAMMVHPSNRCMTRRRSLTSFKVNVEYFGRPSHAGSTPDKGINALDALIVMFSSIGVLRQQLRDDARVHGIITHGGDASNIIPKYTSARLGVRAIDTPYAREVLEKVRACAQAGALASGARLEFQVQDVYYEGMMPNPKLADLFDANLAALGLEVSLPGAVERMGSTDMGNVSQVVPGLHPYVPIVPEGVSGHTAEFAEAAKSPAGYEGMVQAAKAMAMTAVDLLAMPANVKQVREAFERQKAEQMQEA